MVTEKSDYAEGSTWTLTICGQDYHWKVVDGKPILQEKVVLVEIHPVQEPVPLTPAMLRNPTNDALNNPIIDTNPIPPSLLPDPLFKNGQGES